MSVRSQFSLLIGGQKLPADPGIVIEEAPERREASLFVTTENPQELRTAFLGEHNTGSVSSFRLVASLS